MNRLISLAEVEAMIQKEEKNEGMDNTKTQTSDHTPLENDYEVKDILGKGAFSEVRLGIHRVTGESVALKIFSAHKYAGNKRLQESIYREIFIMEELRRSIDHPNVIKMVGKGHYQSSSGITIALEHLKGKELFDRIVSRGYYSETDASIVVQKIASALQSLHQAGIVHRDIKPENCIYETIEEDSELKITDFGLSMWDSSNAQIKPKGDSLVGTKGYIAPECLQDLAYGPACDMWSMGVLLYILLAGYPPFHASNNDELFKQICAGNYLFHQDAWGEISEPAKDLVVRLLTVDPTARITANGVLNHPWVSKISDTVTPNKHLDRTITRLRRFNARRKFRAAGMACLYTVQLKNRLSLKRLVGSQSFSVHELELIKHGFNDHAKNKDGLNKIEFIQVMNSLGFEALPLSQMYDLFDKDNNGTVDYREFLIGLSMLKDGGDEALRFCFSLYDKDNSGFIDREEFASMLYQIAPDETLALEAEGKLQELFETVDANHDNEISFLEFKTAVKTEPILVDGFLKPLDTLLLNPEDRKDVCSPVSIHGEPSSAEHFPVTKLETESEQEIATDHRKKELHGQLFIPVCGSINHPEKRMKL
mmetsp:Transcript_18710/g.24183  ORF Transcript_18710/g.24183 Transcript_18710/m.24183 type:complete len:594 (-) Transcript_18710:441-2222(-)